VTNPLLGPNGAITVFGLQKGVIPTDVDYFEAGMSHYATLVQKITCKEMTSVNGAGAAGGFGFSLFSLLEVEYKSGFELVADLSQLKEQIKTSSLVITGEGKMDKQSFFEKVPIGITRLAKPYNIPVIALPGK
jgi:glycerate kinase